MDIGRIPPQDINLESAILGALMLESGALSLVEGILTKECFYVHSHQLIYEAMINLSSKNHPIDMLTVTDELRTMGNLEKVGGACAVVQFTNSVATSAHIEYHVRVVYEKYLRRNIICKYGKLIEDTYDDNVETEILLDNITRIERELNGGSLSGSIKTLKQCVDESVSSMESRVHKYENNIPVGLPLPLKRLERYIIGFLPTELTIIAARPSVGKTAFAIACASYQAEYGYIPAFFSLEMTGLSLTNRLILAASNVDSYNFRSGKLSTNEILAIKIAANTLKELNLYIDDKPAAKSSYIKAEVKKLKADSKCDIVYVDYVQISGLNPSLKTNEAIGEFTREMKILAKDLGIPIVLLSQINRGPELRAGSGKRPGLSDLKASGSIEEDADIVLALHDPYKAGEIEKDDGEEYSKYDRSIIILKNRQGETGVVECTTNETNTKYFDAKITKNESYKEDSPDLDWTRSFPENSNQQDDLDFDRQLGEFE